MYDLLIIIIGGAVPASFPDGKLPKEFEGMPLEEFER